MREKCMVFFEALLLNICVNEKFLLILQRETMDDNHSSVSLCIFCRSSGRGNVAIKGREDRESGKGKQACEAGEDAE